ncbi:uncharacterized protein LOC120266656 [Dioscorea cayenensis subsp. rotundata]|uniref:Uncharacterized protein LOC120266656 n=1 Tax=Dioscorea cayennensis subsp. rotundata TaxID=55577 RepID=A0AB40BUI1_DIOCR|nr:uncharacterized protein LOC120266656 [Dioscorea cayenensis subsp. rotundata]
MASFSSSTMIKLLHEALMIPTKNLNLILPLTIFSLLSSSLLFLFNYLSITPILFSISINLHVFRSTGIINTDTTKHAILISSIKQSIKQLFLFESIFLLISFIIFSFIHTSILHSSSLTYLAKQPTLQDLLTKINKSWKRPLTTQLIVSMLNLSFMFFVVFILGLCFLISINGSFIILVFGVAIAFLLLYLYIHLSLTCSMAVVISALEEGYRGTSSVINRAAELIKERKKEGLVISMVNALATFGYYGTYTYSTLYVPQITYSPLANGLIFVNVSTVLSMMVLSGYIVFYYECKRSHGDEEMAMKG